MATLRINAENLGTVSEVRNFLADIEAAYNSLYAFDLLVEITRGRTYRLRNLYDSKGFIFYEPFLFRSEFFLNFFQLQTPVDLTKFVLPGDELVISKVNIQSPGWWEFLGIDKILEQIRGGLADRHERKKDKAYRNRQEEMMGDLDIQLKRSQVLQQQIETLKSAGFSDVEIKQMVGNYVTQPLNQLGTHQDSGLIGAPDRRSTEENTSE